MLLSITTVSSAVWLYFVANDRLYGGWIHLFLALALAALFLHLCLPRFHQSAVPHHLDDPLQQRRDCSVLDRRPR